MSSLQWNLVTINSRGPSEKVHFKRNFTGSVAIFVMPGDLNLVRINQVFNCVCVNEVPLYVVSCPRTGVLAVKPRVHTNLLQERGGGKRREKKKH